MADDEHSGTRPKMLIGRDVGLEGDHDGRSVLDVAVTVVVVPSTGGLSGRRGGGLGSWAEDGEEVPPMLIRGSPTSVEGRNL